MLSESNWRLQLQWERKDPTIVLSLQRPEGFEDFLDMVWVGLYCGLFLIIRLDVFFLGRLGSI